MLSVFMVGDKVGEEGGYHDVEVQLMILLTWFGP